MNLRKLKPQAYRPSRYEAAFKTKHSTPKDKFESLFFKAIDLTLMEIKTRFDKQNITPVIQMAKFLKDACFESLESLSNCSIFSDLLNFDSLKTELSLWQHANGSSSFQEFLKSKRSSKL